jgi:SAM-dependent methyltransferase
MPAFSTFDTRNYRTVDAREGYDRWAATYEDTVEDAMDVALLERLGVDWGAVGRAADLGCGTGRTGAWLAGRGVGAIDGVDVSPRMLEAARARGVYRSLREARLDAEGLDADGRDLDDTGLDADGRDLDDTGLPADGRDLGGTGLGGGAYDLVVSCLVDEHLADLGPLYAEAARLLRPGGRFVIVGFHPHFIIASGMPTHFDDAESGEPLAIETHVHLLSDHVAAGLGAGLTLAELRERLIDDGWIALKPKWERHRDHPISFAAVWSR